MQEITHEPWMPELGDIPDNLDASKRVHIVKSEWLDNWWVGHGKDESCQIEGTTNHWFWLAYLILGLVDPKDAPYSEDKPLPYSPEFIRFAINKEMKK